MKQEVTFTTSETNPVYVQLQLAHGTHGIDLLAIRDGLKSVRILTLRHDGVLIRDSFSKSLANQLGLAFESFSPRETDPDKEMGTIQLG